MDLLEENKLFQVIDEFFNEQMQQCILSKAVNQEKLSKVKIRPLLIKNVLNFQAEEFMGQQVWHKNMNLTELKLYLSKVLTDSFKQLDLISDVGELHLLISKKGKMTIKKKYNPTSLPLTEPRPLAHNRKKHYILPEGEPIAFLIDLGVMTKDGRIVASKYDKFKQINRFLEFIEDILPRLSQQQENLIIDFGCGKSYLTFAMYYYLKEMKQYPIRIIGLDLKKSVIEHCNQLSSKYGFTGLDFYYGDIASYEEVDQVDMVVTLHACDTATDFALAKAVHWGAKVILSVPCCQHELNGQLQNNILAPVLQYGLIKERMAALYTDALRAELLESQGYRTQILEFIEMEHTPKNILIRAVLQGDKKENRKALTDLMDFLKVTPTLADLLDKH